MSEPRQFLYHKEPSLAYRKANKPHRTPKSKPIPKVRLTPKELRLEAKRKAEKLARAIRRNDPALAAAASVDERRKAAERMKRAREVNR